MINICHAGGYLGRDPEIKQLNAGGTLATFSFASTEKWRGKDGEQKERTTWFNCKAWGKTAELVGKHFEKGSPIFVTGRYQVDEYEDKDGQQKRFHYVKVDRVEFLPSVKQSLDALPGPKQQTPDAGVGDADIPF